MAHPPVGGNPLQDPLSTLLGDLNLAYGMLYQLLVQLEGYVKAVRERSESAGDLNHLFVGTALTISDITYSPDHGWQEVAVPGRFFTRGEEFLRIKDELLRLNCGWAVSQGWERFESFLFDIVAAYLTEFPALADATKLAKWQAKRKQTQSRADFRDFVRWSYRGKNNKVLLSLLRSLGKGLEEAEERNIKNLNLASWYAAVAEVRHASTHSDQLIRECDLRTIDAGILRRFFPGVQEANGYRLRLDEKSVEEALRVFAEYGFQIFKALCRGASYDWDVLRAMKVPPAKPS